jgi:hypothetical protein
MFSEPLWCTSNEPPQTDIIFRDPFFLQFAGIAAVVAAIAAPMAAAGAVELNDDNYDEMTAGKGAFIKFLAPW